MTVTVRLFAALREAVGAGQLSVQLSDEGQKPTVSDLLGRMGAEYPSFKAYESVIRAAVNDQWSHLETELSDGDEVALLTPVSGG